MVEKTIEFLQAHGGKITVASLFSIFLAYKGYDKELSFSAEIQKAQAALREASRQLCPEGVDEGALQVKCTDSDHPIVTFSGGGTSTSKMYESGGWFRAQESTEGGVRYCTALGQGREIYTINSDSYCAGITREIRGQLEGVLD